MLQPFLVRDDLLTPNINSENIRHKNKRGSCINGFNSLNSNSTKQISLTVPNQTDQFFNSLKNCQKALAHQTTKS